MRTFILAFLLSGCSFISDSEHSGRVAQAQVVADEDADGAGPIDDTGTTSTDSDQDADDTGSAPPDTDDTGSAPPDTDDTGASPPDTDDTGASPPDTDDTGTPPTDTDGGPPTDIDGDGFSEIDGDCVDTDSSIFPGAEDVCDGVDNDCDGEVDEDGSSIWYWDGDGDHWGDESIHVSSCSPGDGWAAVAGDCDDTAVAIHPDALEVCNGVDDDCDTLIDDDDGSTHTATMSTYYHDEDGDLFGDPATSSIACEPPSGTVSDDTDCDDEAFTTHPDALEYCNSVDDDCNDLVDDDAVDALTWYEDADIDTFGNPAVTLENCWIPIGYVADNTDCDDTAFTTHPGSPEIGYDGEDNDCNDLLDDMSIAGEALWSVTGTYSAPELGSAGVTSAGDVDGNGIDDLLISVPLHDAPGRANCGAIAFFEGAVGIVPYTDAYLLVEGTSNAKSGRSIVIGNVDDDLAPEIAHAGHGATGGGIRRGEVWIYDVNGLEGEQTALGIKEGRIRGHHTDHANGTDLAAGDFSGDGFIELIIGAPGGADRAGDASIYEEGDGYMNSTLDHSDSTLEMGGEVNGDRFGSVIENVGDVTGDGLDDIVVCAPQHLGAWGDTRGTCWLFTQPVSRADGDDKLDATEVAWASFSHDVSTDEFGQHPDSIAGGDFLGTSTNEIAFGLPGTNTVLIYEDAAEGGSFTPADAAVSITGSGRLGSSLSGSTDLDGDGADDLLLGAPTTSLGSLYFLPNDSIIGDLVVPGAESGSWHGNWTGDGTGFAFSGLGDFNEDGTVEFAVAAPKSDHAAADAGQVWIIPAY